MDIGDRLHADRRILGAAALLHDIGRPLEEETGESHSILSGTMSDEFLKEIDYSTLEIERVKGAIRTHRFSEKLDPTTLEGRILSDADKLDAIGAIGVFRSIAQAAITQRGIQGFLAHADEKLLKLHELMYLEESKILAKERHGFLQSFVDRLRKETEGF